MKKQISPEEDDDEEDDDTFDEKFGNYFKSSPDNYLSNAKARRRIEELLEDKKFKDDFDDYLEF
tara:strand:+ start:143 stop:334 length:192 start_codon:yes stop_codon:yes gene_type:complete